MPLSKLGCHKPLIPYFKSITYIVTSHNLYSLNCYIDRLMQSFFASCQEIGTLYSRQKGCITRQFVTNFLSSHNYFVSTIVQILISSPFSYLLVFQPVFVLLLSLQCQLNDTLPLVLLVLVTLIALPFFWQDHQYNAHKWALVEIDWRRAHSPYVCSLR